MPFGTISLHPAKWDVWARADVVELMEAISLSLNIDPGALYEAWRKTRQSFDFLAPDEKLLVWKRVKLSESHLGGKLRAAGEIFQGSKFLETRVRLVEFADFAKEMGWPNLPARFPCDPVDWNKWGKLDVAAVWEAVAIATANSPDQVTFYEAKASFGKDFNDMLSAAMSCLGVSLPVHSFPGFDPFEYYGAEPPAPEMRAKVLLGKFCDWAENKKYTLPSRFPRVMKGSEPECPGLTEAKPAEVASAQNPPIAQEPPSENREIGENARETLLTIIAMLAGEEKLKKAGSEARKMERKLILRGIESPKYRMIFNHLKAAKQVLENRTVKPKP